MRRLLTLSIFGLLLGQAACIRYVPSRNEIDSAANNNANGVAGPDEFNAYEKKIAKRLADLQKERAALVSATNDDSYRIARGDQLAITVFGLDELKSSPWVSPSGTISLALIGDVPVEGMSLAEVQQDLNRRLIRFVRHPDVQVSVNQYQGNQVSVIGEVAKPGRYPLKRTGEPLIEVLSEAGGRSDRASGRIILVPAATKLSDKPADVAMMTTTAATTTAAGTATQAPDAAGPQGYGVEIDIADLLGSSDRLPLVMPLIPGDTIVVPEIGSFQVDGEAIKPGSYPLSANMSVLSAVAAAGGLTYSADVHGVELIRDIGAGKKASRSVNLEDLALHGGSDLRLRAGDMVRIPSDSGLFRKRQIVEVLNGFFRVGVNRQVQ